MGDGRAEKGDSVAIEAYLGASGCGGAAATEA